MIPALFAWFACAPSDPGEPADTAAPSPGAPDYPRDPALDIDLDSAAGAESHRAGEACTHCHQAHADGPGIFTAAGTVYRPDGSVATDGFVELWAGGATSGALVATLPIDASGNFYTTSDLGLPAEPVQPVVRYPDGSLANQMPWPTESASCNQCHTPVARVVMP